MKKIVAVNASPRIGWNTALLVQSAAEGAQESGAQVEMVNLYRVGQFTGCLSCFGCKREPNQGRCVVQDGLAPVLENIRQADGLILGTANYLGSATAGFLSLYERLIFQSLTYNREHPCCNSHKIPVLFIMTSNAPETSYAPDTQYGQMVDRYIKTLCTFVGPTKMLIYGDTMQVTDYSIYDWTLFDAAHKYTQRSKILPQKQAQAKRMGAQLLEGFCTVNE